jgi:CCR4-NOT transcriptional regulation complex NOT5 subunit
MSEAQNLQKQIEEQTMRSAQEFFGDSLGRIKGQLQNDRAQLESLAEQSSPNAQAQLQEYADYYKEIEDTLDQAAQDQGLEDVVDEAAQGTAAGGAAQQAQEALGGAAQQAQEAAEGAAQQAQDTAGQAAGQAQEAAGQVTDQAGRLRPGCRARPRRPPEGPPNRPRTPPGR